MITQVLEIAVRAGEIILEVYEQNTINVLKKSDDSPVTVADMKSHRQISADLKQAFTYPIVSEEEPVPYEERSKWERYWLVDPLDGTKNFIAGDGEFTVNIALIEGSEPVLGVVYVPVTKVAYVAEKGAGARKIVNGKGVSINNQRTTDDLICAVSRFHNSPDSAQFCEKFGISQTLSFGSSLKLCKLAEGEIDVYPRFVPTREWDTAAAQCVVEEAGGKVIDIVTQAPLAYNKENIRNNGFVASRNDLEFVSHL